MHEQFTLNLLFFCRFAKCKCRPRCTRECKHSRNWPDPAASNQNGTQKLAWICCLRLCYQTCCVPEPFQNTYNLTENRSCPLGAKTAQSAQAILNEKVWFYDGCEASHTSKRNLKQQIYLMNYCNTSDSTPNHADSLGESGNKCSAPNPAAGSEPARFHRTPLYVLRACPARLCSAFGFPSR